MRSSLFFIAALLLGVGCNTAREQQEKVDKAQAEANDKIAQANQEADRKIDEARADAQKKTADATADFAKMREDFRHDMNTKLTDLDKKIADLEARAKTEKAPKRAQLDTKLADIHASRQSFATDYQAIDTVPATSWDDFKKRVDKSYDELAAKVEHA